jgi:hypothetical protein
MRPMASRLDRRLENLLAALAARLGDSSEAAICLSADEEDDVGELAEALVGAGLLLPAEPASAVICDGCEQNCAMPVEIAPAINGRPGRAFIVCDKRDDIGRVRVEPARLCRWTFSLPLLARALAKALKPDQEPAAADTRDMWLLGNAKIGGNTMRVCLARSAKAAPTGAQLAIVLADTGEQANGGRWITLADAFSLRNGRLTPRADVWRAAALSNRYDDPTVALEIRFDFGEVLLINRITGESTKIATPHLDSQTHRVFKVLYDNPGQVFTTSELEQRTGIKALKSLHKFPENLNVRGNLKKLFFEVSRRGIRFRREVTLGQLATHRVDPKNII